jgi:hypothetical protein
MGPVTQWDKDKDASDLPEVNYGPIIHAVAMNAE